MQMRNSVSSQLTLNIDMKLVVSLILLWVTTADPRIIKGNGNPQLSSPMDQKFSRLSRNADIGTRANCLQDYSPCTCRADPGIYVTCDGVPIETVRDVFQRVNDSEIDDLYLYNLLPSDDTNVVSLPADLLGDTSVTGFIDIRGSLSYPRLVIDPLVFRASQNSLTRFAIVDWDFGLQKDFSFLNGFNKLEYLWIYYSSNIFAFQYLPPLTSLRYLRLSGCSGLIHFPDLSPVAKLEYVEVDSCSLNDEMADEIVAQLIANSTDSLLGLSLSLNSLTRMPNQLGSPFVFPQLWLNLGYNNIKTIENGTFQGNITMLSEVYLFSNELVAFEENVFKELLESLMMTVYGYLMIYDNPFACGCDMAWLIRDNRNLLPFVIGYCGSDSPFPSFSFQNLDPESFANCPIIDTGTIKTEKTTTSATSTPTTPTTTTENPNGFSSCENKPDGIYANPFDDCSTTFYKCSNGQTSEFTCPADTVFNPQIGTCDFPYNVAGWQST